MSSISAFWGHLTSALHLFPSHLVHGGSSVFLDVVMGFRNVVLMYSDTGIASRTRDGPLH